jgi:hypothetical protein
MVPFLFGIIGVNDEFDWEGCFCFEVLEGGTRIAMFSFLNFENSGRMVYWWEPDIY